MRVYGSAFLAQCYLCVLTGLIIPGTSYAQTATYSSGSIYDLDPPSQQSSSANSYLETMLVSMQRGRMRPIRDYHKKDLLRRLGRSVGRLAMNVRIGDRDAMGFCTVSLIARDLILTNHHCIVANPDGKVTDALLWMGYLTPGSREGVKQYGVELEPVETDRALDYAIHRVRGRPGAEWGTVTLASFVLLRDRQSLFILHHPRGGAQHVSLACETGTPAFRKNDLLHRCDTLGGSSGAPVFDFENRSVVGLHYRAIEPGRLNGAKRMERLIAGSPTLTRLAALAAPARAKTGSGTDGSSELAHLRAELARLKAEREEKKVAIVVPPRPATPSTENCGGLIASVGTGKACLSPGDTFSDCVDCPTMVVVPAGSFMLGLSQEEIAKLRKLSEWWQKNADREGPQHEVTILAAFAVGKFEISRGQFARFVKATGYDAGDSCRTYDGKWKDRKGKTWRDPGFTQDDSHPVVCVNWDGAKAYVKWLNTKVIDAPYRLLTEAEWEYAARAGTTTTYIFGESITRDQAQFLSKSTVKGGSFKPNAFGLSDMHGNAWEWVEDCLNKNYNGAPTNGSARTTGDCSRRVVRGGSWYDDSLYLGSAIRHWFRADGRSFDFGFRLARTLNP